MFNVTLILVTMSKIYDRTLLDCKPSGFQDNSRSRDLFFLSRSDDVLLEGYWRGWCQLKINLTDAEAKDADVATLGDWVVPKKTEEMGHNYPGKTEVHSLPYVAANEASIDGSMAVEDKYEHFPNPSPQ